MVLDAENEFETNRRSREKLQGIEGKKARLACIRKNIKASIAFKHHRCQN